MFSITEFLVYAEVVIVHEMFSITEILVYVEVVIVQ